MLEVLMYLLKYTFQDLEKRNMFIYILFKA